MVQGDAVVAGLGANPQNIDNCMYQVYAQHLCLLAKLFLDHKETCLVARIGFFFIPIMIESYFDIRPLQSFSE